MKIGGDGITKEIAKREYKIISHLKIIKTPHIYAGLSRRENE